MDFENAELGQLFDIQDLKKCCRLIYGGIAWPDKRPGFLVVLAAVPSYKPENWKIYLLYEFESNSYQEIIKQFGLMDSTYEPDRWHADMTNNSAEELMQDMRDSFNSYPSETDLIEMKPLYPYLLGRLKKLLNLEHRRLELKNSKLLSYMGEIEQGEDAKLALGDYPAIESLAYAVIEMLRILEGQSADLMPMFTGDYDSIESRHGVKTLDDLAYINAIDDLDEDEDEDEGYWYTE